jgi:hypothetical protein
MIIYGNSAKGNIRITAGELQTEGGQLLNREKGLIVLAFVIFINFLSLGRNWRYILQDRKLEE